MAISSPGVGSGLDVNGIISQLIALERKPIQQTQTQIGGLQSGISAWGQIKSGLAKLQDAASKLLDENLWKRNTATSSNESALAVRTTGGAVAARYDITVQALAQAQAVRSAVPLASSGALGLSGRLEFTRGTWAGGTFNGSGSPTSVTVEATDTIDDIARKVNEANAGVSAVVVRNGSQASLVFKSRDTGAANGFEVRAYDDSNTLITDGSTGLGALSYFDNGGGIVGMDLSAAAQDAAAEIDGVAVSSATNTLSGVISGLTLELKTVSATPVTVTVNTDTQSMGDAVKAFQQAFNDLSKTIKDLTRADPTGAGNGPLRGDQAATGILTMLRNYAGSAASGTGLTRLTDLGLTFQRDGSLGLDITRLEAALADPNQVRNVFAENTAGIGRRIRDFARDALAASGAASSRERTLQETVKRKNAEIERIEERVQRSEQRLRAQYTALDAKMAQYTGLSNYINQQLGLWNKK